MGLLERKVAVITGGTTGLGAAAAMLFRDEGAKVVVTGKNPETLAQAREELVGVEVIASDASDPAASRDLASYVGGRHGQIDVLLANAGAGRLMPIEEVDEGVFDAQFHLNIRGMFFLVKSALEHMPDGSSIVLTGSAAASVGVPGQAVYAATKGAVRSFGRTLAAELGPRGIRVNTVSPGIIPTPGYGKLGMTAEQQRHLKAVWVDTMTPLRRVGTPDDFARAALFLASSQSGFVTGTEMLVDGGLTNA